MVIVTVATDNCSSKLNCESILQNSNPKELAHNVCLLSAVELSHQIMTLDNTSKDEDRLDLSIAIVKYNNIINTNPQSYILVTLYLI